MKILLGTCSWTDPTLLACGRFYPQEATTPQARLRHYSSQFPLVEVDSTYYSLLQERTAAVWVERTPAGFRFDVKAFRLLTHHPTAATSLPKDIREALPAGLREKANLYLHDVPGELREEIWNRFERALGPLRKADKLGVVLFQFPPWFRPSAASKDYLIEIASRATTLAEPTGGTAPFPETIPVAPGHEGGYVIAVEFRHAAWLAQEHRRSTWRLLEEAGLAFVCVDEPQGFSSSVPPVAQATREDVAVVRFHGRNRTTWEQKGITAAERFNYLYTEDELREWIPRIRELAGSARETHVLFNNCFQDRAVINARQMMMLLEYGTASR